MEDVGIPIRSDSLLKTNLSEIRTREEVNEDEREGEKRQKIQDETITTPKQGSSSSSSGGLLDNLLAKLSSPRANPNEVKVFEDSDSVDVQGGSGGVIDKISSFFHIGGGDDEGDNVKNDGSQEIKENGIEVSEVVNKNVGQESEGKSGTNGGGSIMSKLIPDGVAPESSDEASMLIHSVVHD